MLAMLLWACLPHAALAQTPSPLQEWQYPGGISLYSLFVPDIPEWRQTYGLAELVQPYYAGGSKYRFETGPVIDVRYYDTAFASVGEGLGVNFLHGQHYRVGVSLGYDLGRDEADLIAKRPAGLGDIDPAPVLKLFGSYVISKQLPIIFRADVRQYVGGADGAIGDLEAYMPLPGSSEHLMMIAGPSVTFADRLYQGKEFGVTAAQAAASGYPQFNPHGSANAFGMGYSATWIIKQRWFINVEAAAERLLGSGASSPISSSTFQGTVVLSFAYHMESPKQ